MKWIKIICIVAIIGAFVGCVLGYQDNLIHSAYTDPHAARKELHSFDVFTPVLALVAMSCFIIIYKEKRA